MWVLDGFQYSVDFCKIGYSPARVLYS